MCEIVKGEAEEIIAKEEEKKPEKEIDLEIEYNISVNYIYIISLIVGCLLCTMQYSAAMLALDSEKIWGEQPGISQFKMSIASTSGIYGATAGCSIGSIPLHYGRQRVMIVFVFIAILGLIVQTYAYEKIEAAIIGRAMYGFAAGVFYCMVPKIIQENTL
jgi:MFS family permease